jgi:hypothetical protein
MTTKIYNVEFPKWLNDTRTIEQLAIRILVGYLAVKETGMV